MIQESRDLNFAQIGRVALTVKKDKSLYPVGVCFFGPAAVVPLPNGLMQPIQESRRRGGRWIGILFGRRIFPPCGLSHDDSTNEAACQHLYKTTAPRNNQEIKDLLTAPHGLSLMRPCFGSRIHVGQHALKVVHLRYSAHPHRSRCKQRNIQRASCRLAPAKTPGTAGVGCSSFGGQRTVFLLPPPPSAASPASALRCRRFRSSLPGAHAQLRPATVGASCRAQQHRFATVSGRGHFEREAVPSPCQVVSAHGLALPQSLWHRATRGSGLRRTNATASLHTRGVAHPPEQEHVLPNPSLNPTRSGLRPPRAG